MKLQELHKDFRKLKLIKPIKNKALVKLSNKLIHFLNKILVRVPKGVKIVKINDNGLKITKIDVGSSKAICYFHGGGFWFEVSHFEIRSCIEYAKRTNRNVYIIHYSLSYDKPYPTNLFDGILGYKYIKDVDKITDIVIMGASAGGFIASNVCKEVYNYKVKPTKLCLVYPVVAKNKTQSKKKYNNILMWNGISDERMWEVYLNGAKPRMFDEAINVDTYIEICEVDPLHDEGKLYYEYLKKCGTNVTLNEVKGACHGYDCVRKSQITKDSMQRRIEFLK